jgi:hypothetical protein
MKTNESIICPWLDKNIQVDDFYTPALRSNPLVPEQFPANFTLDFSIPESIKNCKNTTKGQFSAR